MINHAIIFKRRCLIYQVDKIDMLDIDSILNLSSTNLLCQWRVLNTLNLQLNFSLDPK